ncbi:MAG: hypothetical protein ABSF83_11065 [Nitrososphaerales archaeon]|jgi:hypothetical protein
MTKPEGGTQAGPGWTAARTSTVILIVVLAIVIIGTGVGIASTSSNGFQYACLSATRSGSDVDVTTTGLMHHIGSQYFISCAEGATVSAVTASYSCMTVSPRTTSSNYPAGSVAYDYYLTAAGGSIALVGAPVNATVVTQPTTASIEVTCG